MKNNNTQGKERKKYVNKVPKGALAGTSGRSSAPSASKYGTTGAKMINTEIQPNETLSYLHQDAIFAQLK